MTRVGWWPLFRRKRLPLAADSSLTERLQHLRNGRDIDGLIDELRRADSIHKNAVARALREITGQDLGTKARQWRRWRGSARRQAGARRFPWGSYVAGLFAGVLAVGLLKLSRWWRRAPREEPPP